MRAKAGRAGAVEREQGGREDDEGEDAGGGGEQRLHGSVMGVHERYSRIGGGRYMKP
jgi:hypothetical protein